MTGRDGNRHSRNAKVRQYGFVAGAAVGAFVAAAAMATGSAAPAKADFEDLLDPIIQPLLTQVTDSLSSFDPAAATDLTSWSDSLQSSLNSLDVGAALPSTAEPAAALPASDVTPTETAYIPLTMQETTEPTVNASIDGSTDQPLLVDTGSSGLVIPDTDLGSNFLTQLESLIELGVPSGINESGYSGGVDYIYLTYNNVPVDYDLGSGSTLDTTAPVEVEVYSWDSSDPTSFFTNDAFQNFLASNDSTGGILGIGDNTSGGAGESPFQADGYDGVTVDEPDGYLIASDGNPGTPYADLPSTGSTPTGDLTEGVSTEENGGGTVIDTAAPVTDDIDSAGVYGTIPSSIAPNGVPDNDWVTVYDNGTPLYSYEVENAGGDQLPNETPSVVSGSSIDSGYEAFEGNPVYIDYGNDNLYFDNPGSVTGP
jgi:hypothetical protein